MKIIHTSDIHLDASFAAAGMTPQSGQLRRQSLRDVFHQIMTRAAEWPADLVLIAGDLFEQDRVSQDTVAFIRAEFERIRPIPVFISPAEEDPYSASSPYALEAWPANVFILNSPVWQSHPLQHLPVTVHGFAYDGPTLSASSFSKLSPPKDGRIHIALAHGAEESAALAENQRSASFKAQDLCSENLHYLALGHAHAVQKIEGDFSTVAYYSGAPEGRGFDETGMRHYLEVEIEEPDQSDEARDPVIRVQPVASAQCIYESHSIDCSAMGSTQELIDHLRSLRQEQGPEQLLRIELYGVAPPALDRELAAIQDLLSEDLAFISLHNNTAPSEEFDEIARENTSLGVYIRRLNTEIQDAPDEAHRRKLLRVRELGLAAYRGKALPVHGLEGDLA